MSRQERHAQAVCSAYRSTQRRSETKVALAGVSKGMRRKLEPRTVMENPLALTTRGLTLEMLMLTQSVLAKLTTLGSGHLEGAHDEYAYTCFHICVCVCV